MRLNVNQIIELMFDSQPLVDVKISANNVNELLLPNTLSESKEQVSV